MRPALLVAALAVLLSMGGALAAERSVTLKVDTMNCPACPYIIKQSLARIDGVIEVRVSFAEKKAQVTFDDGKTDVAALIAATTDVGFPSRVLTE